MGVPMVARTDSSRARKSKWRACYLNRYYQACDSYPSTIVVPRAVPDEK